jgi:hypothetical protein
MVHFSIWFVKSLCVLPNRSILSRVVFQVEIVRSVAPEAGY